MTEIAETADAEAAIGAEAELPALVTDETVSSDIDSEAAIVATTEATLVETASPVMEIETVEAIGVADTSVRLRSRLLSRSRHDCRDCRYRCPG